MLVRPALNVFSHSLDYALKRLSCNRTMEQSKLFIFYFLVLGSRAAAAATVEENSCFYSGGKLY